MNIDRSNYEVWFIDWLDGNLNSFQTKGLYNFLDLNPDLKEEFNDLTNVRLLSQEHPCPVKDELKRSVMELSESQFEYLCAAYLENDLSDLQKTEIDEIIANDPEKKRVFMQIINARLSPLNINYKHKKQLLKSTPVQRIIRLSIIGLSTAAAIAIIVTSYLSIPRNLHDNKKIEAGLNLPNNNLKQQSQEKIPEIIQPSAHKNTETVKLKVKKTPIFISNPTSSLADQAENNKEDSSEINKTGISINKIKIVEFRGLSQSTETYELAASYIYVSDEEPPNERSKIGKYLAKTFREKFLKEKTPQDSPLKAYEIAEAGVSGINKIFGWEMALDKKNDENGNLKSVYFSSRIIKFNAPIKKSGPLP